MGLLRSALSNTSRAHPSDGPVSPLSEGKKIIFTAFTAGMLVMAIFIAIQTPQAPVTDPLAPAEDGPVTPEEPPTLQESPFLYENETSLKCHFPSGSGLWWWDPIIIEDETFSGSWCTSSLRLANIGSHVIVRNCTFLNIDKIATSEEYGIEIANSPKVRVENCTFDGVENGILIVNTIGQEAGINMTNNRFLSPDDQALSVIDSENIIFAQNDITAALAGIRLETAHNVSIFANTITECPVALYSLGDNTDIWLYWNYFANNGQTIYAKAAEKAEGFSVNHPTLGHGNYYGNYVATTAAFNLTAPPSPEGMIMPSAIVPSASIWASDAAYPLEFDLQDTMPLLALTDEPFTWDIVGISEGDAFGPIAPQISLTIDTLVPATINYTINGMLGEEASVNTITTGHQQWQAQLNQTIWSDLPSGSVDIEITVRSALGREYRTALTVFVDLEGPSITIHTPLPGTLFGYTPPALEIVLGDASTITSVSYALGIEGVFGSPEPIIGFGDAFTTIIAQALWDAVANDSDVAIRITATDEWENTAQQSISVHKTLTPPWVEIITPLAPAYVNAYLPYHVLLHDAAPAYIQYQIDGGEITNFALLENSFDATVLGGLAEGVHTLTFIGYDAYGTFNSTSVAFSIDRTAPSASALFPTGDDLVLTPHTLNQAPTVIIGFADASPVSVTYSLGGASYSLDTTPGSTSYSASGILDQAAWDSAVAAASANNETSIRIEFTATDAAGNTATVVIEFQLPEGPEERPIYYQWLEKVSLPILTLGIVVVALGISIASYIRSGRITSKKALEKQAATAASDRAKKPKKSPVNPSKLAGGRAV